MESALKRTATDALKEISMNIQEKSPFFYAITMLKPNTVPPNNN